MSAFCEDETRWDIYFSAITGPPTTDSLQLQVLEWHDDLTPQELSLPSATKLVERDSDVPCSLRVVFAPLGARCLADLEGLKVLFRHYGFPSATLSERIEAVTHSFGASSPIGKGIDLAWCHFLCKDLQTRWAMMPGGHESLTIIDNGLLRDNQSQANSTWKTSDYFLHIRREKEKPSSTTLLCFGASRSLIERFRRLLGNPDWRDAVEQPALLLNIVYEDLYHTVDDLAWRLADLLRPMERATLDRARNSEQIVNETVDFTGLHNVSKNCIYINEAVEAVLLTLDNMTAHFNAAQSGSTSPLSQAVVRGLQYRKVMFQSTQLRLRSLEKRMANVISLSFNLVTQQDSRMMQNDSSAMKAIAVMTLVFLPATGISSIFSMPFFSIDFGSRERLLQVAASFWIFWVVTLPLTGAIFLVWLWIYRRTTQKRTGGQSPSRMRWRWDNHMRLPQNMQLKQL